MPTATEAPKQTPVQKEIVNVPPVGWAVWWFPGASVSTSPQAAIVTKHSGNPAMLNLHVLPAVGQPTWKTTVRHVDDTFLETHPDAVIRSGGWDWIPGNPAPAQHTNVLWERAVRRLHAIKHDPKEIARRVELATVDTVVKFLTKEGITPHGSEKAKTK